MILLNLEVSMLQNDPIEPILSQNKRLGELAYDRIFELIASGVLAGNEKLNEKELASLFGISRLPIREAIRMLESRGLLIAVPYIGTTVKRLSAEEIQEICMLKLVLEPLACKMAVLSVVEEDLHKLEDIDFRLEEALDRGAKDENAKKIQQLDREFHFTLYRIADLPRLSAMIDQLWDWLAYWDRIAVQGPNFGVRNSDDHRSLLQLLQHPL